MAGGAVVAPASTSNRPQPAHKPPTTFYVFLLTALACIGGLLFGYDTGVTSSVMLFLPKNGGMKPLTTVWQELIVSITPGVAAIGALLAGKSSDLFGRRPVILVASLVFFIGAVVCACSPERWTLLVGRSLLGIAIGFASMIIPVYISEGAPCHMRGTLITIYQLMIASGFILANAISAGFAHIDPANIGWRLMFGFAAVPSAIQFIGFLLLRDTPRYLYKSGQIKMAEEVLSKIYGGDMEWVHYDMEEIREATEAEEQAQKEFEHTTVIARIVRTPHVLKALAIGCSMQMIQQLIGINTILYYTSKIIQSAGVEDDITTIWISCGISAVQAVATLLPMKLIEKLGRRPILLISIIGVIITLCMMGGTFVLINHDSAPLDASRVMDGVNGTVAASDTDFKFCSQKTNCDFCVTSSHCGYCFENANYESGQCLPISQDDHTLSTLGHCSRPTADYAIKSSCRTKFTVLPIIVMVLYLVCFAFGMGPMPWVFNAEIYPLWARSTCVSLSTFTNWVFNLLIALTFLSLGEAITKFGAFFLYAGFATCGLIIFYFFVPETKGMAIEEIENLFKSKEERERLRQKEKIQEFELSEKEKDANGFTAF